MDFFEAVSKRGSYRGQFLDQPIPEADMRKMLEAAIKAPSGYNMQTTSFVVVTEPELKAQIAALMPSEATESAPAIIVVVSERKEADGFCFEMQDYASATETLLLAITAMGYASVWMDGDTEDQGHGEKIKEILNIPADKTVRTILPVGVPAGEVKQNSRKTFEERVSFNKF